MAVKKRTGAREAHPTPEARPPIGVMFMVEPRHRDALQDAARKLRDLEGGRGRADSSRVLRALLDAWIAHGASLPGAAKGSR